MRDVAETRDGGAVDDAGGAGVGFDAILASRLPDFTESDAVRIAGRDVRASRPRPRRTSAANATRRSCCPVPPASGVAIMKVSNSAEDPATLDMEALAVLHARRADPTLPVALPRIAPGADPERDRRRRLPSADRRRDRG